MKRAWLLAVLVALATSCKSKESGDESNVAKPEPPPAPAAVNDAAGLASNDEAPIEAEPAGPEVIQTPQAGFELRELAVGEGVLLWMEHQEQPFMQRVFRRDLSGGEPEQLGKDGKHMGLVRVGLNAQALGPEGVWELSEPGKQRLIEHRCAAGPSPAPPPAR